LCPSPTPFRKPPLGAVEGKALGKDLRKEILTEQRFPNASAYGKTSATMRNGPAEEGNSSPNPSPGTGSGKKIPSFQGSTQEPWQYPFGDLIMANGWDLGSTRTKRRGLRTFPRCPGSRGHPTFLRFPSPGRDPNRKEDLFGMDPFQGSTLFGGWITGKTSSVGNVFDPFPCSLRGSRDGKKDMTGIAKVEVPPVPVGTPRTRIMGSSGLLRNRPHLKGACLGPLKSQGPRLRGSSAALTGHWPFGP
jgi:hypothetical protein